MKNMSRKLPLLALLWIAPIPVVLGDDGATYPAERIRLAAGLGFDAWSDLGDLQPFPGGDFDEVGTSGEISFHGQVARIGRGALFLGADLGVLGHDSDVRGVVEGEDLQTSVGYLTPSAKLRLNGAGRQQYFIDAGIGYYDVSMEEWEDDCYWDCDVSEYYDDSAFGGYVGASADFDVAADGAFKVSVGAKVHFVDFDDPVEIDSVHGLSGPIYQLHVSAVWGR